MSQENTPSETTVVLERRSSFYGMAAAWPVYIDNKHVGTIKNGQRIAYRIMPGQHHFFFALSDPMGGVLSNVVELVLESGASAGLVCELKGMPPQGEPLMILVSAHGGVQVVDAFSSLFEESHLVISKPCSICTKRTSGVQFTQESSGIIVIEQERHSVVGQEAETGYICNSCNALICSTCARQRMKSSLWSGYEKQLCPRCGKPFGGRQVLLAAQNTLSLRLLLESTCKEIQEGQEVAWKRLIYLLSNYVRFDDLQPIQILIGWANRDQQIQRLSFPTPTGFICPRCSAPLTWKSHICPQCQSDQLADVGRDVMDFVPFVGTFKRIATYVEEYKIGGDLANYEHKAVVARFQSREGHTSILHIPALAWYCFPPLVLSYVALRVKQPGKVSEKILLREVLVELERIFLGQPVEDTKTEQTAQTVNITSLPAQTPPESPRPIPLQAAFAQIDQQSPIHAAVPEPSINKWALASFILSLVSLCGGIVTGIPAIVLGFIALRKIDESGGQTKGKGFAWAGIVVGFVLAATFTCLVLVALLSDMSAR